MCGIAGSVALRGGPPTDGATLRRMTSALAHRGPDAAGHLVRDGVALGFRRLAFVDLAGGDQPMTTPDGAVAMVCNGEVYDHEALRAGLRARGHRFRSRCDVEVLLHLYEEEGPDLLHRVDGQFALVLHDRRRDRVLLARDRTGIAPLYWTVAGDHLVFGSEVKALLEHPGVAREVDLVGLDQVLTFPGLVAPRTMFRGVRSLPAGHLLDVRGGTVRETRWWDLDYPGADADGPDRPVDPAEAEAHADTLRDLLRTAVRRRLRADVRVGFYLSGGLDSSLIGALATEAAPGTASFSVTFPDAPIDESGFQRAVATKIGSRHHEAPFSPADLAAGLERMVRHAEMPVKESYNVCSLALSALARREGVSAVLSGEGADELFGGYVGYRFDRLGRGSLHSGDPLRDALEDEVRTRLWGSADVFYERRYHAWREEKAALLSPAVRAAGADCLAHPVVDPAMLAGRPPVHRRSYLDVALRLSEHLLADHGDRMAMANSVETRYPFLDRDVVEFARTLPTRFKVGPAGEKLVVKQAARGLVPPEVVDREKYGFRAPGSPHLLRAAPDLVGDLLAPDRIRRQGYFDPATVAALRSRYLGDGFDVHPHFDDDLLMVVITFGILLDAFGLADHG